MCGIFFSAYPESQVQNDQFCDLCDRLESNNAARGPDAQRAFVKSFDVPAASLKPETSSALHLRFFSSELRLRGSQPVLQPHERDGNILCWNGEIFEGLEVKPDENDGVKLFQRLCELSNPSQIPDLLATVEGPYAFVFYHSQTRQIIFGRDPLGRRSLLMHRPKAEAPHFFLSSVSVGSNSSYDLEEVSASDFYGLDIEGLQNSSDIVDGFTSCFRPLSRSATSPERPFATPRRINTDLPVTDEPLVKSLSEIPTELREDVDGLIDRLDRSVLLRVHDIPDQPNYHKGQAKVALLFSGGIDSTVLAYFAHKNLPIDEPIDLLNVAFENPHKLKFANGPQKQRKKNKQLDPQPLVPYMVPDRVTGLQELEELRRLCPGRVWNFVEVNVPYEESVAHRPIVEALMWPSNTVMDLSLALALYFASRGIGQVRSAPDAEPMPYTSPARVILSGLGSDELLGGYGRHRAAYNSGGWQAVIEELQLEIDRIPLRNLGRDDRVISCHGKETRHPFLSLSILDFVTALPVHHKLDPRLEMGVGEKMLLRLAAWKLGLVEASERKKRAMQFGSHSARMEGERGGTAALS
ncbi:hypothetical protein HGRIS_007670 [Hohenbuehelia grisea]|uniref:Glutamine amidotransferase type-2 domain-containing protein n=1 Tax=Hohenbuehelia grisea TaxID=104357 RepID=A0ABR3J5I4_9AGAR